MSKFVQATRFRIKEGQVEAAKTELRRWMDGYKSVGATASVYVQIGGGTTGEGLMSVEFPDGDAWVKVLEDPRLLEARERMNAPDWPFEPATSSIFQELASSDD